jgi:hypothetical protein
MSHLEFHPHAFVDDNNIVINVSVFDESAHNTEFINEISLIVNATQAICCCTYGMANIGDTWNGVKFIPVKPFASWIWNDKLNVWETPIPEPKDGLYYWNEETTSWILVEIEQN